MGFFDKFFPKDKSLPKRELLTKKEDSLDLDVAVRQVRGAFDLSRKAALKLFSTENEFLSREVLPTNFSRLVSQGTFEILLLNTTVVLEIAPWYLPNTYFNFRGGYLGCLEHEWNQLTDVGHDFSEILANRITFYTGILKHLNSRDDEVIAYNIVYTDLASKFFEDPLALNHKRSTNGLLGRRVAKNARLMVKNLGEDLSCLFESNS